MCFLLVLDEDDMDEQQIIDLGLIVDGITIFKRGSSETWSSAKLVQRLLHKAGDFIIKKCEVTMLHTSTEIAS